MPPTLDAPPPPSSSPWQRLYAGAHRLRGAWFRRHGERLPRPVVSVGNLCWGGGGKTPLTAAVAAHLRDAGRRVCILSRGYGRETAGVVVVSTGDGPRVGPRQGGDEPVLLAAELPGVAVVVGRRRAEAGRVALDGLPAPPDLFLLDDGFSHLALHRDLDLLAFPAADPFAGGRLPPAGRLREPLAASARADAAVLTGVEDAMENEAGAEDEAAEDGEAALAAAGAALAAALAPYGFRGRGFASRLAVAPPRLGPGRPLPAGARVLLVAGIARPERFFATARALAGVEVVGEAAFPDHHRFPEESLRAIARSAADLGAQAVLATSKDRVKLDGRLALPLADLPVAARPQAAFWSWLDGRLAALADGAPPRREAGR